MTRRTHRELFQAIEREGLTLVSCHLGGSGHVRALVRNPAGQEQVVTCSSTCSDRRGMRNTTALLRRIARGQLPAFGRPGLQHPA